MLDANKMYELIDESDVITDEMVSVLRELDTTNSIVTQASLNSMLIQLRKRVDNGERLSLQSDKTEFNNVDEFDAWVQNTFYEYSVKLYMRSI